MPESQRTPSPSPSLSSLPSSPPPSSNVEFPNQQHLKDVHKKFRIIEGTRRIYHGESEGIMRRQEATLANLRTDNKCLRETVDTYYIPDYELKMAELHKEADKYGELVEIEAKKLQNVDNALQESCAQKLEAKSAQGGVNAPTEKHKAALLHVQITENRIHKAVVDLNIVERQNQILKMKMEEIREEREYFESIRLKLEKELQRKEKEMENSMELCSLLYDERNDVEERYTDLTEIYGEMEAYKMWKESKGWAVMEPEPLQNFLHIERRTEPQKEPKEYSAYFRKWIEVKALANIQDILLVDNVDHVKGAVQQLQQKNAAIVEQVNQLLTQLDALELAPKQLEVKIKSFPPDYSHRRRTVIRADMETTCERIYSILKDLNFADEEYLPIINEMKRQVGSIFKEAGCPVDESEVSNAKGRARLEEALAQWFMIIDNFVDEMTRPKARPQSSKQ